MKNDSNSLLSAKEVPVLEKNILIIEDEEVFARAVEKKLSRANFLCRSVGTLADAGKAYEQKTPDLILLDMASAGWFRSSISGGLTTR